MFLKILALFLLSSASGLLMVQLLWRLASGRFPAWLLSICLGLGVGAGLASCIYTVCMFISGSSPASIFYLSVETVVLLGLLSGWIILRRRDPGLRRGAARRAPASRLLLGGWLAGMAFAAAYFLQSSIMRPIGNWDAFTIWNLHARFLAFGGPGWKELLGQPLHPDYPLLIPGYIARFWRMLGSDTSYASFLTAGLFTFGGIGFLMAVLKEMRGWNTALVGGLVLCCSNGYIRIGADQYADVPLSFFFMAVLALIILHDIRFPDRHSLFVLAGLCAGFALWTKIEGWLMLIALIGARLIFHLISRHWRQALAEAGWFFAGLAPLLLLALFYRSMTPPNDMLAEPSKSLAQLFEIQRYFTVWNNMNIYFIAIGKWASTSAVLMLALLGLGLGTRLKDNEPRPFAFVGLVILFLLMEYFFTYILTPYDLMWHIQTSLDRLLMHIYPALLMLMLPLIKFEQELPENDPSPENLSNVTTRVKVEAQ